MTAAVHVSEAREHLGSPSTAAVSDARLETFIARAESAIARRTGPLVAEAKTARVRTGSEGLALPDFPVLSLTSVTLVGGSAVPVADLFVSPGGVVQWSLGVMGTYFPRGVYDVAWQAGWGATPDDVPADLKLAVLELVRHFWETQRGESRTRGQAEERGPGFTFPNRVEELLEPFVMEL
jgi:uncharacterized phiE125 gp8 family phage protein